MPAAGIARPLALAAALLAAGPALADAAAARSRPTRAAGGGHVSGLAFALRQTFADQLTRSGAIGFAAKGSSSTAPAHSDSALGGVARLDLAWHLGGGSAGFDGGASIDSGRGLRWPASGHGLVARGGIRAQVQGNDDYYLSLLQLPQLDAGYQFMQREIVLELSGRVALVWDGRHRAGPSAPTTNIDLGPGFGALVELGLPGAWMTAQLLHADTVSSARFELCSEIPRALSLCVRAERSSEGSLRDPTREVLIGTIALGLLWGGHAAGGARFEATGEAGIAEPTRGDRP